MCPVEIRLVTGAVKLCLVTRVYVAGSLPPPWSPPHKVQGCVEEILRSMFRTIGVAPLALHH